MVKRGRESSDSTYSGKSSSDHETLVQRKKKLSVSSKGKTPLHIDFNPKSPVFKTPLLRRRTSTSKDSTAPDTGPVSSASEVKFRAASYQQRYESQMQNKQLLCGRSVDLVMAASCGISSLFSELGIFSLLSPPKIVYPRLVKEFFANLSFESDFVLTSFVQEKVISVNTSLWGLILNLPCSGLDMSTKTLSETPLSEQICFLKGIDHIDSDALPSVGELTPFANIVYKIIRSNLNPKVGRGSQLALFDVSLLFSVLSSVKINVSFLMFSVMKESLRKGKGFPFASFLTLVFKHFHLDFSFENQSSVSECINDETLKQSGIQLENQSLVRVLKDKNLSSISTPGVTPSSDQPPPSSFAPSSSTSPKFSDSDLNQILKNQEKIIALLSSLDSRVSALETGSIFLSSTLRAAATKAHSMNEQFCTKFDALDSKIALLQDEYLKNYAILGQRLSRDNLHIAKQISNLATDLSHITHRRTSVKEWHAHRWVCDDVEAELIKKNGELRVPRSEARTRAGAARKSRRTDQSSSSSKPKIVELSDSENP